MTNPFSQIDHALMRRALVMAQDAARTGEVPVGAVLVDSANRILAEAGNGCIGAHDPSGHAEMVAIRAAAARAGNYRLPGCKLYVTLEPCIMCAGACIQARIGNIIYGALDQKAGALHSRYRIGTDGLLNHSLMVQGGLLAEECSVLLSNFFKERRKKQL